MEPARPSGQRPASDPVLDDVNRTLIELLQQDGLIYVGKGRQGSRLSTKGAVFLACCEKSRG